jgi:hypothetical protein
MWAANFILGPLSNSDPSRPKNGLQVRHNNARHVLDKTPQRVTRAWYVATMRKVTFHRISTHPSPLYRHHTHAASLPSRPPSSHASLYACLAALQGHRTGAHPVRLLPRLAVGSHRACVTVA